MSCPICSKKVEPTFRPFCSKRCADLDLAKWFSGSYAIPSEDFEDIETALEEAARAAEGDTPKPH